MPIVQNPLFTPASGYRPVEWISGTTLLIAKGTITIATAVVTLDGTVIGTLKQAPYIVLGPGPLFTYGFKWDVQSLFQRIKAPKAQNGKSLCFGTPGVQYNDDARDCYGELEISIEYFYVDAITGLLVNQGVTELSIITPAFIATRQHEDSMALTDFIPGIASPVAQFLTNAPLTGQTICLQDSHFINSIRGAANELIIKTFDSSGVLIDTGFLAAPAIGTDTQVAFGVGPNEIRNTTFTSGSVNIDNPAVATYTVEFGFLGLPLSDTITFALVPCCADEYERLHWLNLLGGTDAYTFKSLNERIYQTTSDEAQKPLTWASDTASPHSINDRGSFKIDSRAVINRKLESTPLTPDVATWLTELLSSPEVYLETDAGLVPVIIADVEQVYTSNKDNELPLLRFSINAKDSNERIIQRN